MATNKFNLLVAKEGVKLSYYTRLGSKGIEFLNLEESHQNFHLTTGVYKGNQSVLTSSGGRIYRHTVSENPFFEWLEVLAILSGIVFYLISYVGYKFIYYRRESKRKELYAIRLKAIKNQIDPHFTLNLLNSIRLHILKENVMKAEELFDQFTHILKYSLRDSDQIGVALSDELDIVSRYLSIEREQNKKLADFSIEIDDRFRDVFIPKMLIQEHVENAKKHGINHLEANDGFISISVLSENGKLKIIIEDNGVGRGHVTSQSTGRGLDLTYELIELFNRLEKRNVSQKIEDLKRGTRVTIIA